MERLFVIVKKDTNKVMGFTSWEDYTREHPDVMLIEINEDHEVWLSENPQQYVYIPEQNIFVISQSSSGG